MIPTATAGDTPTHHTTHPPPSTDPGNRRNPPFQSVLLTSGVEGTPRANNHTSEKVPVDPGGYGGKAKVGR